MSTTTANTPLHDDTPPGGTRRDFLTLTALAGAAVGVGAIVWPFIDSMEPAADTLAAGEAVDVDLSKVAPGQQIVVVWRGKPIFVVNRTPEAIKGLSEPKLLARLADASSKTNQQPKLRGERHPLGGRRSTRCWWESARTWAACRATSRT